MHRKAVLFCALCIGTGLTLYIAALLGCADSATTGTGSGTATETTYRINGYISGQSGSDTVYLFLVPITYTSAEGVPKEGNYYHTETLTSSDSSFSIRAVNGNQYKLAALTKNASDEALKIVVSPALLISGQNIALGTMNLDLAYINIDATPKILDSHWVNLNKIRRISKFRSAVGGQFYDGADLDSNGNQIRSAKKHIFESSTKEVEVYAPCRGTVFAINSVATTESATRERGSQIIIQPAGYTDIFVSLSPVFVTTEVFSFINTGDQFTAGSISVTSGKFLGHADLQTSSSFEIYVEVQNLPYNISTTGKAYVSYFNLMTNSIFASYEARGISTREAAIITKDFRQANPIDWNVAPPSSDWLELN